MEVYGLGADTMASISKRESGAWQNTSYGIRATATDTMTTLPTTIYGDGANATVSVYGNTTQNGTPSTSSPIMPEGCGELEAGQYKIPILSNSTTTLVYLGEVETTRKIKKLVFDGTENWAETAGIYFDLYVGNIIAWSECICTHCKFNDIVGNNTGVRLWVKKAAFTEYSTVTDFKAFLAAQYAAGTPVTVWYVLATPETAVINEPLMKIDGYADEVNNISIPTTDGANTLSVDTTVQPSEVSVNYHGWHMGTVHERNSGQWD